MTTSNLSDFDRRDALNARHPGNYYFADEEPETRRIRPVDEHRHLTDGYCADARCQSWQPAD